MNTYAKYCPNVFVAKCEQKHDKGETIVLTTKYGKENDCIVFNMVAEQNGFYYYSIVRADGFNTQEWAKRRAERLQTAAANAESKSNASWEASHEGRDFLILGEPIKVGHHSERRHRALIERNHNRMDKAVALSKTAEVLEDRASYWANKAKTMNLSMPECLEYYEYLLDKAKAEHEGLKNGSIERAHSFSLTYAKKAVNEAEKNLALANKLWG